MNIYTRMIKKLKKNETDSVIADILLEIEEKYSDGIEESGIIDFSEVEFLPWLKEKYPELAEPFSDKDADEDIFYSLLQDSEEKFRIYGEYVIENNLVNDMLEVLEELEYGYEEYNYIDDEDDMY